MPPVFENCGNGAIDSEDGEECDGDVQGCTNCLVDAVDISAGGSFDGVIGTGSFDRYRLELTVDSAVRIETTGADGICPGDTVMQLLNETEDTVVFDRNDDLALDDGPTPPCSLFEAKVAAGVYHLIVTEYNDDDAVNYLLNTLIQALVPAGGACTIETENDADDCILGASCRESVGGANLCVLDGCGNGFVDAGEGCDDGNLEDADGCSSRCIDEALCGNGVVNTGEECDEMVSDCSGCLVQPLDVSAGGTFSGAFGDGSFDRFNLVITEETTVQIDTNDVGGDCFLIDTIMNLGRITDDGVEFVDLNDDRTVGVYCSRITQTLQPGTYEILVTNFFGNQTAYELSVAFFGGCGDGVVDEVLGETCDDGNMVDGDGCSALCVIEQVCGNGLIQEGETCDDDTADCVACQVMPTPMDVTGTYEGGMGIGTFDLFNFTIASSTPVSLETLGTANETGCPDGLDTVLTLYRANGESWDFVTSNDDHDASAPGTTCSQIFETLEPGDYQVKVTEYDDLGIAAYRLAYTHGGVCGDGAVNAGESCDDGNIADGDGCSATCASEDSCGDGFVHGVEECDDANFLNGDGCDIDCRNEVTEVYEAIDTFIGAISGIDDFQNAGLNEYRITVDGPSILTAFTTSANGCDPGNTVLELYALNDQGFRIEPAIAENDDDDGGTFCSALDGLELAQGRYGVVVTGFNAIDEYTLNLMLTRDASVTGTYPGSMGNIGSDGFDIDVVETSDVSVYVTIDGNCVDGAAMSVYGADLNNPIAGPNDFTLLASGCQGLELSGLTSDLYYLELRSDELQQSDYVLHLAIEAVVAPNAVDFCELKWPDSLGPVSEGYQTDAIYAQVYEQGITDVTTGIDVNALVQAEVGYGPADQDPLVGESWMWFEAAPNGDYGVDSAGYAQNNDEYMGTLTAPISGTYAFAARFTVDGGQTWTLCDFDGSENGYDSSASGVLRVARVPTRGELLISEILYDSNLNGDTAGEWFEIQNITDEVLSLVGLELSDEGTDSVALDTLGPWGNGALVEPGAFVVLSREGDAALNGGVNADYAYGNAVGLANDSDELVLQNSAGIIDQVNWTGRTIFDVNGSAVGADLDPVGASISLSGDGSGTWCEGVDMYGEGGLGTPGAANPVCACAEGTFDHDDNPLTPCQACATCAANETVTAACTPTSNTQCEAQSMGWTEDDARDKVEQTCSGCHHGANTRNSWTLSRIYGKVRSDSTVGTRMPRGGPYWADSDVEKLRILVEGI